MDQNLNNALARNVYLSKAQDVRAAVDIYKETGSRTINSIQSLAEKFNFPELSAALMRGGNALSEAFPVFTKGLSGINSDNLLKRVLASTDAIKNSVKNSLPDGFIDTVKDYYKTGVGLYNESQELVSQIGGVVSIVSSTDFNDVRSIGSMVNMLNNSPSSLLFKDFDGLSTLCSTIVYEASSQGMYGTFSAVVSGVEDNITRVKIATNSIRTAIKFGDIGMLRDINGILGPGNLYGRSPSVFEQFNRQFTNPRSNSILNLSQNYQTITSTYEVVKPGWRQYNRNEVLIDDVSAFNGASPDMQKVVQGGAIYSSNWDDQKTLLANSFGKVSVEQELARDYPLRAKIPDVNVVNQYYF